jgi:acetyl-CoA C-acetyltransferase
MVPAYTMGKVCGSGLKATHLATQAIRCGDADIIIAGGQENMSASPHVLNGSRDGFRMGDAKLVDTMIVDGLWDVYNQYHMGVTAENVARKYDISRAEQDEFALKSQLKAEAAQKAGKFKDEIIPSRSRRKKAPSSSTPTSIQSTAARIEALSSLRPAFNKEGTVTAGNASGLNDGAAAVIMMSASKAQANWASSQSRASRPTPRLAWTRPSWAWARSRLPLCLQKAGWTHDQVDLMEINEAFAAQAMAVNKEMGWDTSKINVNGGAIALGHPIGASGARVLVTLLHEMVRRDAKRGLASLCIGGGMGVALAVERD